MSNNVNVTTQYSHFLVLEDVDLNVDAYLGKFIHVRTSTSPTHNPLPLFCWKGWGFSPNWHLAPLLTPFSLPMFGDHWFLFLGILLGNHGDNKLINFHHIKSLTNLFHNVECLFQCGVNARLNVLISAKIALPISPYNLFFNDSHGHEFFKLLF
jgi:hypothetical protein